MARLKKRGKVWHAIWREGGKKRSRAMSPTKSEADRKLVDLNEEIAARRYGHKNVRISWATFKAKYLSYSLTNKKPASHDRDKRAILALERFKIPAWVSDLNPDILEDFKSARKAAGIQPGTINRDLGVLKNMLTRAKKLGFSRGIERGAVPALKVPENRPRWFTAEEFDRLVEACNDLFERTMVHLGVYTGFRREEICRLQWQDVDFDRKVVLVVGRDGWTPKDYEAREVPLWPQNEQVLLEWRRKIKGGGDMTYILPTSAWRSEGPTLSSYFRRIMANAEVTDASFHTMRHTFATWLVNAGVDPYRISKWLGHASIKTTEIYLHHKPFSPDDPVLKLDFGVKTGCKSSAPTVNKSAALSRP